MAASRRVLAVDLGGTNIRVAVVSAAGELTHRCNIPTDAPDGPEAVIRRMTALIADVGRAAALPPDAPVGVASPGPLDPRSGVVLFTPNLPGWRDVPLGQRLTEGTKRPVRVANDGNCAALGEARFGCGTGVNDLIYLALGTGVGGGVLSGGRLIDGVRGLGSEVGHVVVAMDGPRCTCGSVGCLEAFVGGWAIGRQAQLVATTDDGLALREAAGDQPVDGGAVARAALAGDPAARLILQRAGRALGAAMGAFVNIFNPELIVIGGGVATIGDLLLDPARDALRTHSFISFRQDVRIELSALGDDTALYGAGALALTDGDRMA